MSFFFPFVEKVWEKSHSVRKLLGAYLNVFPQGFSSHLGMGMPESLFDKFSGKGWMDV